MGERKEARIGFISTRLSGTDGVSLEVTKWVRVLEKMGHTCFFFAGECDWPSDKTFLVKEAYFKHPDIERINADLFDDYRRSPQTTHRIDSMRQHIKSKLKEFIKAFEPDLLIAENSLSLPVNIPLGLALTELIVESNIPTVGHHHDFWWERPRFLVNAASDFLQAAFPPAFPSMQHIVINSYTAQRLALRTGSISTVIPNVMDYNETPPEPDDYANDLRPALGLQPDEYFLLQPTRIVPRKQIERAIELAARLELSCSLVISHASGDEGDLYAKYLKKFADMLNVQLIFAADEINFNRGTGRDGQKIYSLADAYRQADLITYPSRVEGFGNALLETIYYRKPIIMNFYEIFKTDMRPKGFDVLGFNDFIDEACVERARDLLLKPGKSRDMVENNFKLAQRYYSFERLEHHLHSLINESIGTFH